MINSPCIEYIQTPPGPDGGGLLAIILRSGFSRPGVHFVTDPNQGQQVAYMRRPAGTVIPAHTHRLYVREVGRTQEVLVIRAGRLLIDFYNEAGQKVCEREAGPGDTLVLLGGGHGMVCLDEVEMIECKTGPYDVTMDKIYLGGR